MDQPGSRWSGTVADPDAASCREAGNLSRLDRLGFRGTMNDPLIAAAIQTRKNAHAPFSKFQVGAAVQDERGHIYSGCNVENATYGLTVCAERVAIFKAISDGARRFHRVAVVADTENLTPPCGACRQILWEFCGDVEIVLANLQGKSETLRLGTLFPRAFDASFL